MFRYEQGLPLSDLMEFQLLGFLRAGLLEPSGQA
jgi:hypothetical protein